MIWFLQLPILEKTLLNKIYQGKCYYIVRMLYCSPRNASIKPNIQNNITKKVIKKKKRLQLPMWSYKLSFNRIVPISWRNINSCSIQGLQYKILLHCPVPALNKFQIYIFCSKKSKLRFLLLPQKLTISLQSRRMS